MRRNDCPRWAGICKRVMHNNDCFHVPPLGLGDLKGREGRDAMFNLYSIKCPRAPRRSTFFAVREAASVMGFGCRPIAELSKGHRGRRPKAAGSGCKRWTAQLKPGRMPCAARLRRNRGPLCDNRALSHIQEARKNRVWGGYGRPFRSHRMRFGGSRFAREAFHRSPESAEIAPAFRRPCAATIFL
jgi:hypothetical protein